MKIEKKVSLIPLQVSDREKFITDLQAAFQVAVIKEFGKDEHEHNLLECGRWTLFLSF